MTGAPTLLLRAVFERAARTLQLPLLMISIHRKTGGDFDVVATSDGVYRVEVEAAALDLLRMLRDELQSPTDCPSCIARKDRVELAIAALEAQRPDHREAH